MSFGSTFENPAKHLNTELSRACTAVESFSFGSQSIPSVCVVCCSTSDTPHDTIIIVAKAMQSLAKVQMILLSETGEEKFKYIDMNMKVITVPLGTKLSKLRRIADLVETDLFCICDPDFTVDEKGCLFVLRQAIADMRAGKEVVAFGIVEGKIDRTLLSQVIAVDKWLSHRILRRFLWTFGIGLTLPGQFLMVSSSLLHNLPHRIDSYLDDLYLGWVARQRGTIIRRVSVVTGCEEPRMNWSSLLTQRCRWMRGLMQLFYHLLQHPLAIVLLVIHFGAYHGLPIVAMIAILSLAASNPLCGLGVFFSSAAILSIASRQSLLTSCTFLGIFPFVHLLAMILCCVPLKRSILIRR